MAARGYTMLGGLGGFLGPSGSMPRKGLGGSIASFLPATSDTLRTLGLGRTAIPGAMLALPRSFM